MSVDACAALVARGDPDRFLAVMAAPVAVRARLLPLYAFNLEVARAPWVTAEPLIAEMRLQWWRDVVAGGEARAHEVAGPLHGVIRAAGLPVDVMDRLIEARRWDIGREAFAGQAAMDGYLEDTAGGLMWLACVAAGSSGGEQAARDIGWAAGLAAFLRAAPDLAARGRVPLVDDDPGAIRAKVRYSGGSLSAVMEMLTGSDSLTALPRRANQPGFSDLAERAKGRQHSG